MSTYERARDALGIRLRELRRDARLTGQQLAEAHGWHRTKIYKIEGGKQTPSDADLEAWAATCHVPEQTPELIAALRSLEGQYVEFRRMFRRGMAAQQQTFAEAEAEAAIIRNFESCFVPGLLQTPEYARYRLQEAITSDGAHDDLDESVAARMARQQILYAPGRRFHFVITESVLRLQLCPPEVLAGQLDKLAVASTLRTVRFGVIPFTAAFPVAPVHGFWIFDDRWVSVETVTAALTVTQAPEVGTYLRTFARLADVAIYGREARALIENIADGLEPRQ
ncbi:helix-turn-helix transcriptional regulator [Nonomuraea sp. NPDC052129]|uniref:helix-turn-helix domain-containing protein n=1 Tax=Nonomuraea sp. NPDC052129 TaxID=3154651 RepID=UPI00343FB4F8